MKMGKCEDERLVPRITRISTDNVVEDGDA